MSQFHKEGATIEKIFLGISSDPTLWNMQEIPIKDDFIDRFKSEKAACQLPGPATGKNHKQQHELYVEIYIQYSKSTTIFLIWPFALQTQQP